ncbi:TVP38/TMEM64 family protein [Vibrio cholerae]|uniref:TVP38/TMEM64 family protein n=1 Tax=Vibrio cholerae TaxID=666 RepID=UPI002095DB97|nr:TVP38/TMEM64 family protein [Vibrio cholerae]MCO7068867.1 TVP38/TMEM64 family protein [Vibrio cholerae]
MYKKLIIALVLIAIAALLVTQFSQYLILDVAKAKQAELANYIDAHLLQAALMYFVVYVLLTAFSIPGATVVTLLGAALFGFWLSLLLASFASTIGATLAFLSSRFLLRDWVQAKFADKLQTINQGIERDGAFYLLSLRLIPIFPFFLINLVMGLTPISTWRYYWVSQLGMLPGTAVYLNAGTQLAEISSLGEIVSLPVLASFVLLGVFPIVVKWIMGKVQQRATQSPVK